MELSAADIQPDLDRRKPGTSRHVTQRKEGDRVEILSGVFEGRTTGTPIGLLIRNEDQRSKDYGNIARTFRPGHADYAYLHKYGFRDYRGGGRSSARLTAMTVAAGAIARKWLRLEHGTVIRGFMSQLGEIDVPFKRWDLVHGNPFFAANDELVPRLESYMDELRKAGDSCGARIDVVADGVPVGLGEPLFDKLDADIAYAMMGINAVKGVEIGAGFRSVAQKGSEHGDELTPGFPVEQCGRGARRHLHRPAGHRVDRDQADLQHSHAAALDRHRRESRRRGNLRPPRSLRGHPRDADRRGDARAGPDGPRAAPPGAERGRAGRHPGDSRHRALSRAARQGFGGKRRRSS